MRFMSFNHALQRQGAPRVCRKVAGHPSSSVPAWPQYPALAAFAMQPVDRPFRFTRDFCVVWALLVVPTFFLTRQHDFGLWCSNIAVLIVAPLFATFVLYGPVLFVRQVIRSGSRGWFVARVFLSIMKKSLALLVLAVAVSGCRTALVYTGSVTAGDDQKALAVSKAIEDEYVRQ